MCLCRNTALHSSGTPTNNCHQIASKCTKSHMEFQKFSGDDTPVLDRESANVATLV